MVPALTQSAVSEWSSGAVSGCLSMMPADLRCGTLCAPTSRFMAKSVEELQVYQKALAASAEVSAIIQRRSFNRDPRLRDQLGSSSERVASLIAEGFEQSTDKHFAQYCYRSRGSCRETRTQLIVGVHRRHLTERERAALDAKYEEVAKMLTGLIAHLEAEDRKHRR
jgi:four helix bundle protein